MSELIFVTGDTAPDITAVLHEVGDENTPIDLTSCSVKFQMRKSDDKRYTVNAAATITNAALGRVKYSWGANDLNLAGEYEVQWEVTYPDLRVQTTATVTQVTVRRA